MKDSGPCVTSLRTSMMRNGCHYEYGVYGVVLRSEISLPLPNRITGTLSQIELLTASASFFSDITRDVPLQQLDGSWYQFGRLQDRSSYVRWDGVGEFLVSGDGARIVCRQFDVATTESFQVYLLGQALSYALVMRGFEPLHATVVVIDGEAVGFLGESGFGKSSLAACFLEAGYQLLTDDLLLLHEAAGRVVAYPGPSRIKLFPKHARRVFGNAAKGIRMNTDTEKLILPLVETQTCSDPVTIKALYALSGPREVFRRQTPRFTPLLPRDAFFELVKNTFNRRILDPSRLVCQLEATARLVNLVPVRKISYARVLAQLPSVREAILSDMKSLGSVACGN